MNDERTSYIWDSQGIPHRGWTWEDVVDLETPCATCEMCGNESVRYVHTMSHPEHPELRVGCICAEKMTDDYVSPKKREQKLSNRAQRRARWLTRTWTYSQSGNQYLKLQETYLTVFPDKLRPHLWCYSIDGRFSKAKYSSEDAAKLALFDEWCEMTEGPII